MSSIPAIQSAFNGVQSGLQKMQSNSLKIANANTTESSGDITEPLVNLLQNEQQVKASAKVIQTSDEMLGSLLDIKV
jgi:flagellar hook protein FlgE